MSFDIKVFFSLSYCSEYLCKRALLDNKHGSIFIGEWVVTRNLTWEHLELIKIASY